MVWGIHPQQLDLPCTARLFATQRAFLSALLFTLCLAITLNEIIKNAQEIVGHIFGTYPIPSNCIVSLYANLFQSLFADN